VSYYGPRGDISLRLVPDTSTSEVAGAEGGLETLKNRGLRPTGLLKKGARACLTNSTTPAAGQLNRPLGAQTGNTQDVVWLSTNVHPPVRRSRALGADRSCTRRESSPTPIGSCRVVQSHNGATVGILDARGGPAGVEFTDRPTMGVESVLPGRGNFRFPRSGYSSPTADGVSNAPLLEGDPPRGAVLPPFFLSGFA